MPMNLPRSLCAAVFAAAVGSAPLCTPVMAQEAHEWDMVTNMARNSYLGKIAMQFAEDVKMATGGTVELEFHEDGAGTRVHISHRMAGEFYDEMPSEFEEGWQDGLQKLKQLVEA